MLNWAGRCLNLFETCNLLRLAIFKNYKVRFREAGDVCASLIGDNRGHRDKFGPGDKSGFSALAQSNAGQRDYSAHNVSQGSQ